MSLTKNDLQEALKVTKNEFQEALGVTKNEFLEALGETKNEFREAFREQDQKIDQKLGTLEGKFDQKLGVFKDDLGQMLVKHFYTKEESLRIFATKEDVKRAVDEGVYRLKVLIEKNDERIDLLSEGHGHVTDKIEDHEKRINKLEHDI